MQRRNFLSLTGTLVAATAANASLPSFAKPPAYFPVVTTDAGKLRGSGQNGILCFRGIPYGADTSQRRFQPPAAPTPWTGVREALDWTTRAPQPVGHGHSSVGYQLPEELGAISEDCLHLNVYTPALRDGRKRPVLFYIHGGAYSGGTVNSSLYDGSKLCRAHDVVVVTVNHRLNLFGYLYLGDKEERFADAGNAGMLDLVLALDWVRRNIAEFGADANCVTIFGQSGGGAKCATLMAMPAAHGLFHRVMTMSGQQITASRPESAWLRTLAVLKALGLKESELEKLTTLPMAQLMEATRAASYYGPVHDGRSLPLDPFSPTAPAISAAVPMILGNTHDETRFLIGARDESLFQLTWETLPAKLAELAPFLGVLDRNEVVRRYREWHPSYSACDVFFAATTDSRSWRGQVIEAERRAEEAAATGKAPTWVYELDWCSPVDGGRWKAPHTLDIPLFFLNTGLAPQMSGDGDEARALSAEMGRTLVQFARTGTPNGKGLPEWPHYELKQRRTMIFDSQSRVVSDPRGEERRYLSQVAYTQPGT